MHHQSTAQTNVVPLHPAAAQPIPKPTPAETTHPLIAGGTFVGIDYIGRELALLKSTARTVTATVRALVAQQGFPAPRNPLMRHGVALLGAEAVTMQSLWKRDDVDRWFAAQAPARLGGLASPDADRTAKVDHAIRNALAGLGGEAA